MCCVLRWCRLWRERCKEPGHGGGGGGKRGKGMQDSVDMLSTDTHITFRLFLDTAVAEAYFMGGRVAMTIPVRLPACLSDCAACH
jgi:hypothetical protein